MSEPVIYRLWGQDDELLYIGMTENLRSRLWQHQYSKPWFSEVVSVTVEWYPTRSAAAAVERDAVRAESPLHNKVRFTGPTKLRTIRVATDLWEAAKAQARAEGETLTSILLGFLQEYVDHTD